MTKNKLFDFGKKEFIELIVPMSIFILIVMVVTCLVALIENFV